MDLTYAILGTGIGLFIFTIVVFFGALYKPEIKKMKKNYIDITVVLDRSGSMQTTQADAIGGFNKFIQDQKKVEGEATLSLIQFDDMYEVNYAATPIKEVEELTSKTFVPRGSTALYDAVGRTISDTGARLSKMAEKDRPSKVIIIIITDGEENSSREYSQGILQDMIEEQTYKYSWEFVYMGSNQDAILAATKMSIPVSSSLSYANNSKGTMQSYESLGATLTSFRTGASHSMDFSASDRERQLKAGLNTNISVSN